MINKREFLFEFYLYFFLLMTIFLPSFVLRICGKVVPHYAFDIISLLEAIVCVCMLGFFMKKYWRKIFFGMFLFMAGVLNLIDFETSFLFNQTFSVPFATTFFFADPIEVSEFLKSIYSWKMLLGVVVCLGFLPCVYYLPTKFEISIKKYFYMFLFFCLGLYFFGGEVWEKHFIPLSFKFAYAGVKKYEKDLAKIKSQYTIDVKDLDVKSKQKVYVVVLSDAVGRSYLSVYGYKYNTTPFLMSYRKNLYLFDDVTTRYNYTSSTLEKILTFSENDTDNNLIFEAPNLMDFYKNSGFKVYWISSNYNNSYLDSYAYLTGGADVVSYRTANYLTGRDEDVLPAFQRALDDKAEKKMIFLHLKGSHNDYSSRYPKYYADDNQDIILLKSVKGVDDRFVKYVKTLMYGDFFLSKIFAMVGDKVGVSSYILYLSDHAEDVDIYGNATFIHGNTNKKQEYEIPFVLWLSETYKENNKEFVKLLSRNIHSPYEINTLNHSLLNLSRLDTSYLEQSKSIFSSEFKKRPRYYDNIRE